MTSGNKLSNTLRRVKPRIYDKSITVSEPVSHREHTKKHLRTLMIVPAVKQEYG
jgi:hypothetical protein